MDDQTLVQTRVALHGLAELVLAGPQYEVTKDIRLRVTPGGFGTVAEPDLRVDGAHLVAAETRIPLNGSFAALASAAGVVARDLRDVYHDGPDVSVADPVLVDPAAAAVILEAFSRGDAAMRAFAPDEEPVLWPEHFDIGISLDEVNYGVSPGDSHVAVPYAYVGPWKQREGSFWNTSFGAARPLSELPDSDAVAQFFREGAQRSVSDRPKGG
jgi:hypothetical protein